MAEYDVRFKSFEARDAWLNEHKLEGQLLCIHRENPAFSADLFEADEIALRNAGAELFAHLNLDPTDRPRSEAAVFPERREQLCQVLVIADGKSLGSLRKCVGLLGGAVKLQHGDCIFVVEITPLDILRLGVIGGVVGVYKEQVPQDVLAKLDSSGRIGADAWNLRHSNGYRQQKENRKGEGLSWDHFEREQEKA